ncbi:NAD-dependent epimerase/dehydratase family protein [Halorubellus sp. JP-L1]|uniref:NAD-dependent epimerase/dehydratase family protein n=1 Tax=Halorubellus sp. JP-L1 TaxID=2715753 RepID=UPI00140AB9A2|nr:NAD-dependent epimerase/dehydratase family protein [Halorubellus sp. JP-L1]NHN43168.1 NAD-dependent epimerase/dehydratase family protein [Halorubellus sp. JP-L1]
MPPVRHPARSDLADATVLVTGGAGFVGSHLVDALAPIADVRVLDDCSTGDPRNVHDDATLLVGDVASQDAIDEATHDVDYVFHLAAISAVPDAMAAPARTLDVNATATARLLERATERDARFVFASSCAIYGDPTDTPIPETERKTPRGPYGVSKLAADQYVRRYADWYDASTVALRFFNVYGPRQTRGVVPAFADRALDGDALVVDGDGQQTRDFVHVDDVVQALLLAAAADVTGEAYNVGTGRSTSIRGLADMVRDVVDADVPVTHDDPRPADIAESRADVRKASEHLGFEPTVSLSDGLRTVLRGQPVRQ